MAVVYRAPSDEHRRRSVTLTLEGYTAVTQFRTTARGPLSPSHGIESYDLAGDAWELSIGSVTITSEGNNLFAD